MVTILTIMMKSLIVIIIILKHDLDEHDDDNTNVNNDGIDDVALCMPQWPELKGGRNE